MLKLFKGIYALYWVLAIAGAVAVWWVVFSSLTVNDQAETLAGDLQPFLALTAELLWVYLMQFACGRLAVRRLNRITAILNRDCDPERYIAAMLPLVQKKRVSAYARAFLQLNLSSGLLEDGRFGEALALLRTIVVGSGRRRSVNMGRAMYFSNFCAAFLNVGEIENAQCAFDDLARLQSEPRMPQKLQIMISAVCLEKRLRLQMAQGDFGGAEAYFSESLRAARNQRVKVKTQYQLAQTYEHTGETDKAREAYRYAAENGNKLWVARLAREKLQQLG